MLALVDCEIFLRLNQIKSNLVTFQFMGLYVKCVYYKYVKVLIPSPLHSFSVSFKNKPLTFLVFHVHINQKLVTEK